VKKKKLRGLSPRANSTNRAPCLSETLVSEGINKYLLDFCVVFIASLKCHTMYVVLVFILANLATPEFSASDFSRAHLSDQTLPGRTVENGVGKSSVARAYRSHKKFWPKSEDYFRN
jgi:hypothetical protein